MISIIVPIYNAGAYLRECLESIARQSYHDLEVLCVDDGSTDDSGSICMEFTEEDSRFRYVRQTNAGVSAARNKGMEMAKGEWITFVDADDIVHADYLRILLDINVADGMSICGWSRDISVLGAPAKTIKTFVSHDFINRIINDSERMVNIWTMLFSNNIIQENLIKFTEGCVWGEDTEFYLKYMAHISAIVKTDYVGYYYRDNPQSACHALDERSLTAIEAAERTKAYLLSEGIVSQNCTIVDAVVEYFVYYTAKQKKRQIYKYLHDKYIVHDAMKAMLSYPRMSRKAVALFYLMLGRQAFFRILSTF